MWWIEILAQMAAELPKPPPLYPWVGPLVLVAMIGALVAWRVHKGQRRRVWDALAAELGLTDQSPRDFDELVELRRELSRHVLFLIAGVDDVERRLVGTIDDAHVEVLDVEGFGVGHWAPPSVRSALHDPRQAMAEMDVTRDRPGYGELMQTAVRVRAPGLDLPRFILMPENYLTRRVPEPRGLEWGEDAYPLFAKRNRLLTATAQSDPAARALFTRQVQLALERNRDLTIEGDGDTLLLYRVGHAMTPERVRGLIVDALELRRMFEAQTQVTA